MEYHEKKYIVDTINHYFKYGFVDQKLKIYDLEDNEVEQLDFLKFLKDELDLDFKDSMSILVRWYQGDTYADYIERNILDDLVDNFN